MLEVGPNFICNPYRGVSIQEVDIPLERRSVLRYLKGRPVYRRTEFLILVRGEELAVVQVEKVDADSLFSPVTEVAYLAGPEEAVMIEDDDVDTGNATQMARAALASGKNARFYVVRGRFQHVNFIASPSPLHVRVVEVVPPAPPKLLEMAIKVLDFDEDLPPMELDFTPIDLRELASGETEDGYIFPCRSSGLDLTGPVVHFLDAGPAKLQPWTLVGCERSRQIHAFLYGSEPARRVEICPKLLDRPTYRPTLMKCCLLERGIEKSTSRVVVPWGARLDEVRRAMHILADMAQDRLTQAAT